MRVQPEEEQGRRVRRGGHCPAVMHTGAGFHPDRCKEAGADHAHQHDHFDPDVDDIAAQQCLA